MLVKARVKHQNHAVSPLPPKGKRFFREVKQDELYITLKDINFIKFRFLTSLTYFSCPRSDMARKTGFVSIRSKMRSCFFLCLELRNEENPNVCVFLYDAVVFSSERDVEGRVLHKNQWLQCPWRASVLLQDDVHPCLRKARCLLLLCKSSKISHCLSNYVHNPFTQMFFIRFLVFIAYVNWAYRGRYR